MTPPRDMEARKHVIIGTAGHVDHGKTCLIQALTGVDPDRLPEEKARGLTIEPGFAPLVFPDGLQAGIVDVPGHEKFIHHMLRGAGGMDLALLVVDAREGCKPQTAEHLEILQLLGLRDGLAAITKTDLADAAQLETVREQVRQTLRGTFLENAPILPVSARTGAGLSELREALEAKVRSARGRRPGLPFRLPLDRVFTVEGFGTVVTGTLLEGTIHREDAVQLSPGGGIGRVRGLQVFGREVEAVFAGQRAAVNLTGLRREDIRRGDTLCAPDSLVPSSLLAAELRLLPSARRPLRSGGEVRLYHTASAREARVNLLDREVLGPGETAFVQLRLSAPLGAKAGDRFILRCPSPPETIGGGVVLDPAPRKHRRGDASVLQSLTVKSSGTIRQRTLQALEEAGTALPDSAALARTLALPCQTVEGVLASLLADGQALAVPPGRYLARSVRDRLSERCRGIVEHYHQTDPLEAGIREAELSQKTGAPPELLAHLAQAGLLRFSNGRYALPDFRIVLTRRQAGIQRTILALCEGMGPRTPSPKAISARFPLRDREDVSRVLRSLLSQGTLVLLDPDTLCCAADLARYRQAAETWFASHETLTLAQYRDMLGVSRDYALLVLERFDRLRLTRREGDVRYWSG